MAGIIPPREEKESSLGGFLFYLSVFLLVAVLVIYFVLIAFQKKEESNLQNLKELLEKEETAEMRSLKEKIKDYEKKIRDIESLLKEHIFASRFFEELERKTHPQVFFKQIELDLKNLSATLYGQTDNFFTLGQQVLILEKDSLIVEPKLEQINIGNEKRVEFVLKFNFSPELIKFKE